MSNPETTLSVLRFLAATYEHRWKPSADQLASWAVLLADIKPEALKRAAVQHAQNSQHPPSVADLRTLAQSDKGISGDEAFGLAKAAAQGASPYSSKSCSESWAWLEAEDPIAASACRAFGGFSVFWEMLADDVPTQRAQFRRIYESMQTRSQTKRSEAGAQRLLDDFMPRDQLGGDGPRKLIG